MSVLLLFKLFILCEYLLAGIAWSFWRLGPSSSVLTHIINILLWPILVTYQIIKWICRKIVKIVRKS